MPGFGFVPKWDGDQRYRFAHQNRSSLAKGRQINSNDSSSNGNGNALSNHFTFYPTRELDKLQRAVTGGTPLQVGHSVFNRDVAYVPPLNEKKLLLFKSTRAPQRTSSLWKTSRTSSQEHSRASGHTTRNSEARARYYDNAVDTSGWDGNDDEEDDDSATDDLLSYSSPSTMNIGSLGTTLEGVDEDNDAHDEADRSLETSTGGSGDASSNHMNNEGERGTRRRRRGPGSGTNTQRRGSARSSASSKGHSRSCSAKGLLAAQISQLSKLAARRRSSTRPLRLRTMSTNHLPTLSPPPPAAGPHRSSSVTTTTTAAVAAGSPTASASAPTSPLQRFSVAFAKQSVSSYNNVVQSINAIADKAEAARRNARRKRQQHLEAFYAKVCEDGLEDFDNLDSSSTDEEFEEYRTSGRNYSSYHPRAAHMEQKMARRRERQRQRLKKGVERRIELKAKALARGEDVWYDK